MVKLLLLVLVMFPAVALGQNPNRVNWMPTCPVSQLDACAGGVQDGRHVLVTDGLNEQDCTVGGGSSRHICIRNQGVWVQLLVLSADERQRRQENDNERIRFIFLIEALKLAICEEP